MSKAKLMRVNNVNNWEFRLKKWLIKLDKIWYVVPCWTWPTCVRVANLREKMVPMATRCWRRWGSCYHGDDVGSDGDCSPEGKDGAHRVEGEELLWQGLAFRFALVVGGTVSMNTIRLVLQRVLSRKSTWFGMEPCGQVTHTVSSKELSTFVNINDQLVRINALSNQL